MSDEVLRAGGISVVFIGGDKPWEVRRQDWFSSRETTVQRFYRREDAESLAKLMTEWLEDK